MTSECLEAGAELRYFLQILQAAPMFSKTLETIHIRSEGKCSDKGKGQETVAVLLKSWWLEGVGHTRLFSSHMPLAILPTQIPLEVKNIKIN